MPSKVQIVFDCANPAALAQFWADALGYIVQPPPEGFSSWPEFLQQIGVPRELWDSRSAIVDPDGVRPRIFFQQVPEGKTAKNRVHLDVIVGDGGHGSDRAEAADREAARLVRAGAVQVQVFDEMGEHWVVLRDPEGNEFCVS